jgi:hypothetical protein
MKLLKRRLQVRRRHQKSQKKEDFMKPVTMPMAVEKKLVVLELILMARNGGASGIATGNLEKVVVGVKVRTIKVVVQKPKQTQIVLQRKITPPLSMQIKQACLAYRV